MNRGSAGDVSPLPLHPAENDTWGQIALQRDRSPRRPVATIALRVKQVRPTLRLAVTLDSRSWSTTLCAITLIRAVPPFRDNPLKIPGSSSRATARRRQS